MTGFETLCLDLQKNDLAQSQPTDSVVRIKAKQEAPAVVLSVLNGLQLYNMQFTESPEQVARYAQTPEAAEIARIACGSLKPSSTPVQTPPGKNRGPALSVADGKLGGHGK